MYLYDETIFFLGVFYYRINNWTLRDSNFTGTVDSLLLKPHLLQPQSNNHSNDMQTVTAV